MADPALFPNYINRTLPMIRLDKINDVEGTGKRRTNKRVPGGSSRSNLSCILSSVMSMASLVLGG
jgi:hypothetical protein